MLNNVQLMKLMLMTEGMDVSPAASFELSLRQPDRPLTLADYVTTSGITLMLEEDVWVNAPIRRHNPNFVPEQPLHKLDHDGERYLIHSGGEVFPVVPLPVPDYYREVNASEEPYTDYAVTHADRVRISPIDGCGMVCTFCDVPFTAAYRRTRIDGLIDSVRKAFEDKALPARHILISGGTPKPEDYDFLGRVFRAIPERYPQQTVDIMMAPAPGLLDLKQLRDWGVNGLSINLEIFNEGIARKIMPQKYRVGRKHFLDFIEQAVAEFGLGKIRSLLIVGLEPPEDTLAAVHELAKRGCDPVLSPFRPDLATPLRDHPVPSMELLKRIYCESLELVSAYPVKLGPRCVPCQHNTLTFPDGSSEYYYS
jgi:pyruvate-formate lyase-activating enzyme